MILPLVALGIVAVVLAGMAVIVKRAVQHWRIYSDIFDRIAKDIR